MTQERANNTRIDHPDDGRFAPPSWSQDHQVEPEDTNRSGMVIFGGFAITCLAGLGFLTVMLSEDGTPALPAQAALAAVPDVATPSEVQLHQSANSKQVVARIAPGDPEPGNQQTGDAKSDLKADARGGENASAPDREQLALARQFRIRADEKMLMGDIVSARALYHKALQMGDTVSAREMGRTYDPQVFQELGVRGLAPDRKLAMQWYRQAASLGDAKSAFRLDQRRSRARGASLVHKGD